MAATAATVALAALLALALAPAATAHHHHHGGPDRLRYDAPAGFVRCPTVEAWHGFFRWVSVKGARCGRAERFVRRYARVAEPGALPDRVGRFACRTRYWRDARGDAYASRQRCAAGRVAVRFYGMA